MFICIGIPKPWRLSLVQVRNFYYFLDFKVLRLEERETHNFYYADCSIWPNNARRITLTQLARYRRGSKINALRQGSNLNSSSFKSQLTAFFSKISQNPQPIASGYDVILIPSLISYPGFLLWHLGLSHPPCASMNTCAQCVPLPVH